MENQGATNQGGTQYPSIYLGQTQTASIHAVNSGYSYTLAVPPQGATRYDATLTLTPSVPGKTFRARLATTCSQVTMQPDEVSNTSFPGGAITFSWSAQYSTQFAQITTDETTPFDLNIDMTGALQ
jgi:hypothetical protein